MIFSYTTETIPGKFSSGFKPLYTKSLIQFIAFDTIQLDDDTFTLFSYGNGDPGDRLVQSIKQFGILHPPIVLKTASDKHIVIAGKKRIRVALEQGLVDNLPCLCLPANTPQPQIYSIILEAALLEGQLSIIEQAVFLKKARTKCSQNELLDMMQKLGHKPQKHIVDNILNLLSLERGTLQAVHEGIIGQNNARKLLKLSAPDQKILVELISALHIGGSKQKKLIELCTELVIRRQKSLSSILHQFYPDILLEGDGNIPQHVSTLLNWLHKECFPKTSEAEANFERFVSQLNLPPHCKLQHSKSFEDDSVDLSIHFKTLRSMQIQLPEIIKAFTTKISDR